MVSFTVKRIGIDLRAASLACLHAVCFALAPIVSFAQQEALALNHIIIDERLHTSGQPEAAVLEKLAAEGFDTVVNLAPATVSGAVADESRLLEVTGVRYINIPVEFRNPTYEDFERFSDALERARAGKVLVHCQVNARASTFTFLYRVVHENAPAAEAYALVKQAWTPNEQWLLFAEDVLARHGIDLEME